uniref:Uncharacterized protein n=1 Tax=Romanomermis culicivorax TaxID=13658 RepID=A0A915L7G7_ROMCU
MHVQNNKWNKIKCYEEQTVVGLLLQLTTNFLLTKARFILLLGEHSSEPAARGACSASRTPSTKNLFAEHAQGSRTFFYSSEHVRRATRVIS